MSIALEQGVQGDAVLLPGSGERCPGDSVKGPQFLSLLLTGFVMSMTLEQGVQGDAVLLPGSGASPVPFPPSHWLLQAACIGYLKSY